MNSSAPWQQLWTDQALMGQMSVLKSILQNVHVDGKYLSSQCLLLSKILDSLVASNRKPIWRSDLLPLVRKVCKHRDNPDARAALLVLLLSVKDAFRAEWLSSVHVTENEEIFTTLKLLFASFTTSEDVLGKSPMQLLQGGGSAASDFQEARVHLDSISNRFYPRLQIISIFVAVHSKVGYEVLMCDFNVPYMDLQDRVYLYVGQKDNTESSTCIVTPLQVNFLVNGHQVERRVTLGYLDVGPQMPSDVTNLVKVGPNVLQVIGEFSVPYVIAVASSRAIERSAKNAELQDYVPPIKSASEVDAAEVDDEVVEGASRVSLRCPISHQRLGMPVKAATCRHLQSFDYDSFLEINETRPAWRCPCCNGFISFPDLRIDRQMEKVLQDTDEKIYEVIHNQDGSWVPVFTEDDETDRGPGVGEGGNECIDLSDMNDEESNRKWQNSDVFQQRETKPDVQTLIAMAENRMNASQTTNPVVWQQGTAGNPVIIVPEFTTDASQSSPSFSGHVWVGGGNSEGGFVNVNGGGLYSTTSGTVDNQVQNQHATSVQSMSAVNHNFQVRFPWTRTAPHVNSPAGPVNRMAPNSAHTTFTRLQPPLSDAPSNIGPVAENGWVRQRQVGQRSPGISLNVQDIGEMRPQWRSTGVLSPQLGRNAAQSQNVHPSQHARSSQSPTWRSPRQHLSPITVSFPQHASPGNLQQQRLSPGINPHHHHPGPGASQSQRLSAGNYSLQHSASPGTSHQQLSSPGASHQRPGVRAGANVGQWRSTTSNVQLGGGEAASEQNWRPAQRMRGSVANPSLGHTNPSLGHTNPSLGHTNPSLGHTNPSLGHTVLGPIPAVILGPIDAVLVVEQQQAPAVPTVPSAHAFTAATNANAIPAPRFQTQPLVANNQQAANKVSLYNGTTWVNAPDFSSAPLPAPHFTGLDMPEIWMDFVDIDSPGQQPQ